MYEGDRLMKKRMICCVIAASVIVVAVILGVLFKSSDTAEADNAAADEQIALNETYARIAGECADYRAALGDGNIYPDYLYAFESNRLLKNRSEEEAAKEAVDTCIRTEALYQKAVEAGCSMSDKELETYIDNEVKAAQTSAEYDAMENIYEKSGKTYAEVMEENKEIYRKAIAIAQWKHGVRESKDLSDDEWNKYEPELIEQIVSAFKKTEEYTVLKNALDRAVQLEKENAGMKDIENAALDVYNDIR